MREINEETKNIMPRAKMMCEGCFAIRKGSCIALNEVPEENCPFWKEKKENK